jgi:hypothetical protein
MTRDGDQARRESQCRKSDAIPAPIGPVSGNRRDRDEKYRLDFVMIASRRYTTDIKGVGGNPRTSGVARQQQSAA